MMISLNIPHIRNKSRCHKLTEFLNEYCLRNLANLLANGAFEAGFFRVWGQKKGTRSVCEDLFLYFFVLSRFAEFCHGQSSVLAVLPLLRLVCSYVSFP